MIKILVPLFWRFRSLSIRSNLNLLAKKIIKQKLHFRCEKLFPYFAAKEMDHMKSRLAGIALGIMLMTSCAKPKNFDYLGFDNIKVLKWGIKETVVGMDVKFYNPNSALQLKRAEVDVQVNNKYLGRTVIDSLIRIPKRDTFFIPMTMTIETVSAVSGILQSVSDSTVMVKLDGQATVGRSGVFFKYPIKYEGAQKTEKVLGVE